MSEAEPGHSFLVASTGITKLIEQGAHPGQHLGGYPFQRHVRTGAHRGFNLRSRGRGDLRCEHIRLGKAQKTPDRSVNLAMILGQILITDPATTILIFALESKH